jgi:isopentenyl diphosphate isomerase/L-lactate dehydrogenase-like FMN-dependent dehydrogenase
MSVDKMVSVDEVNAAARRRLPKMVYDFVAGGAEDEVTLRRNRLAFEELAFRPRVLRDVGTRRLATTVLGQDVSLPVLFGPAGLQGLLHRRGELAAAKAASDAGTIYSLSFGSSYSIEEVRAEAAGPLWLQLSPWRDREASEALVSRAKAAGYTGLILTVDVPVGALRERDVRNRMTIPFRVTPRSAIDGALHPLWLPNLYSILRKHHGNFSATSSAGGTIEVAKWVSHTMNSSATWDEVRWMRSIWEGSLVVKGVQRGDDARRAAEAGADAVIVSNHGGRQLDGVPASIEVLPEVIAAAGSDLEVLVDSGLRRGSDVVKAMALGARACLVARPYVLSLVFGDAGPRRILEILRAEIDTTLALLGSSGWDDLDPSMVVPRAVLRGRASEPCGDRTSD